MRLIGTKRLTVAPAAAPLFSCSECSFAIALKASEASRHPTRPGLLGHGKNPYDDRDVDPIEGRFTGVEEVPYPFLDPPPVALLFPGVVVAPYDKTVEGNREHSPPGSRLRPARSFGAIVLASLALTSASSCRRSGDAKEQ